MFGGYHKVVKFDNGYSASIVSHSGSYGGDDGLFEIAVLDKTGDIAYDTPVASDVVGYLDFADVAEIVNKIKSLPSCL
ncbi:MAG: hypothetical protein EBZ87_03145 [Microbacteriaceae bacterium]|nr:hypothetical protein [Microbacteriaceae bacterium]